MTTRAPIPVAMLADRWVALVLVENGVEVWLDLGPGDLRAALAVMLFVRDGARPERLVWGHQRPALARIVASYDDLVGPNDFARWLRAQERGRDGRLRRPGDLERHARGRAAGGDAVALDRDSPAHHAAARARARPARGSCRPRAARHRRRGDHPVDARTRRRALRRVRGQRVRPRPARDRPVPPVPRRGDAAVMDVDFTKYPPGSAVSGAGRIERCAVCGRAGERRKGTKKHAYVVVHKVSIRSVLLKRSRKRVTRGVVTDECKAASAPAAGS